MEQIIVTRHRALVVLLRERGLVNTETPLLTHASAKNVRGKHVFGVLPLHLAAEAAKVTEIPLRLGPEDRGKEIGIERLREIAGKAITYKVEVEK